MALLPDFVIIIIYLHQVVVVV